MLKWIEKLWDRLNNLVPIRNLWREKNLCNSAFQNKLFAFISDPAGYSVPSNAWNCVCPVGLFAVPSDQEVKRNAGNDRDGNEQHYSSFQAHVIFFCVRL